MLQFVPLSSSINPSFWNKFTELKLNELRLSTDPVPLKGIFSNRVLDGIPPLLSIPYDALENTTNCSTGEFLCDGLLFNTNTIEDFKNADKTQILTDYAKQYIWDKIISGEAEAKPSLLNSFILYMFADLKKYHYYYWFAFPTFTFKRSVELVCKPVLLEKFVDNEALEEILSACCRSNVNKIAFVLVKSRLEVELYPLEQYSKLMKSEGQESQDRSVWLCFADPCSQPEHPGWPLRNILHLCDVRWPDLVRHTVLCLRETKHGGCTSICKSLVLDIRFGDSKVAGVEIDECSQKSIPSNVYGCSAEIPSCLGWEKNERGKMGPRFVNLKSNMDPTSISESAVSLNLRLMKWRLAPDLDLESIRSKKCLLFGAGTLGCNVARCLLGWGVRKISLVDSGQVSYSNPVRQSLFVFSDAQRKDNYKAVLAADMLRNIYPGVQAQGIVATIPMPGHVVGDSQLQTVKETVQQLVSLVESHDVLFLLTDSRESRWFPTLLGTFRKKLILTAALGFDSILVMRHGTQPDGRDNLGCYFCNDVMAPGNSTSQRSLDQQCTVTRPGMSMMAAGHVVELMTSSIQLAYSGPVCSEGGTESTVDDGMLCEDEDNLKVTKDSVNIPKSQESSLGIVPHSIRYYLGSLQQLTTYTEKFVNCSACGPLILDAYQKDDFNFLLKVFESPAYLEEVSGLSQIHKDSQLAEVWDFNDSDTWSEASGRS